MSPMWDEFKRGTIASAIALPTQDKLLRVSRAV
jgi:hypothetical protein